MEDQNILITQFLEKVDRLISEKSNLSVNEVSSLVGNDHLGSTDRTKIFVNLEKIKEIYSQDMMDFMVGVKGINYHELAHVLFSSESQFSHDKQKRAIENVLEDSRIECLFSAIYPKAKTYFAESYFRLCLKGQTQFDKPNVTLLLLTWGRRKFIPNSQYFIDKAEKCFLKKHNKIVMEKVKNLIDDFIISNNQPARDGIVIEIFELLGLDKPENQNAVIKNVIEREGIDGRSSDNSSSRFPKNISKKKTDKAISQHKEQMKQHNKKMTEPAPQTNLDKDRESSSSKTLPKEMNKAIKQVEEELKEKLEKDAGEDFRSIFGKGASANLTQDPVTIGDTSFPDKYKNIALKNQMLTCFKKIKKEKDFTWKGHLKSGKLHSRRIYKIESNDFKVFKKWKTSNLDEFKRDIAIVLDVSGSMDKYITKVLQTGWALGESLKLSNLGNVSIIQFTTVFNVIKSFYKRNYTFKQLQSGGTRVNPALANVEKTIKNCPNKKIMIVISDLQFSDDTSKTENLLRTLDKREVDTYFIVPLAKDKELGDYQTRDLKRFKNFGKTIMMNLDDNRNLAKMFFNLLSDKKIGGELK